MQGQGQQSIAAELAFQQQLAKQLGLKGKNKTKAKGPDDGLDDLLAGITPVLINTCYLHQHANHMLLHIRRLFCMCWQESPGQRRFLANWVCAACDQLACACM